MLTASGAAARGKGRAAKRARGRVKSQRRISDSGTAKEYEPASQIAAPLGMVNQLML
jgi:hypothetical protein